MTQSFYFLLFTQEEWSWVHAMIWPCWFIAALFTMVKNASPRECRLWPNHARGTSQPQAEQRTVMLNWVTESQIPDAEWHNPGANKCLPNVFIHMKFWKISMATTPRPPMALRWQKEGGMNHTGQEETSGAIKILCISILVVILRWLIVLCTWNGPSSCK